MTLTPAQSGFIKGLLIVIAAAVTTYVSNEANLAPVIGTPLALVVAGIASSLESWIRENTGRGLFGAVEVDY